MSTMESVLPRYEVRAFKVARPARLSRVSLPRNAEFFH